jgi:hypothetical protein
MMMMMMMMMILYVCVCVCVSCDDHKFRIYRSTSPASLCNGPGCVLCEVKLKFYIQFRLTKYIARGCISVILRSVSTFGHGHIMGPKDTVQRSYSAIMFVSVFKGLDAVTLGILSSTYLMLKYTISKTGRINVHIPYISRNV